MEENLEAQLDGTKWLERELIAEKENAVALEAKLSKKKKMSSNKASITKFKKKLDVAELSLKAIVA